MQNAEEIYHGHCAYAEYLSRGNIFPIHQDSAKNIIANSKIKTINGQQLNQETIERRIQSLINNIPSSIHINGKTNTMYAYEWHTNNEQYVIQLTENNHQSTSALDTTIRISHWIDAIDYGYSNEGIITKSKKINQYTFIIKINKHTHSYGDIHNVEYIMRHLTNPHHPTLYVALAKLYNQHPTMEMRQYIMQHFPCIHQIQHPNAPNNNTNAAKFPAHSRVIPIDHQKNEKIAPLSQHQLIQTYREIDHIAQTYHANNTEILHHAPHSTECASTT